MQIQEIPINQVLVIRQQVMWPDKPLDFVQVPGDESAIHLGVLVNKEVKSVISLFEKDNRIQFRKFATLVSDQGKGYGTFLLNYVIEVACHSGKDSIWCHARITKTNFYTKFGMTTQGEPFFKNGIAYVKMEKRIS